VPAGERALLTARFELAVEDEILVRQFAPALGGVGEERADAAVDVEGVVALRRARVVGELVERGFGPPVSRAKRTIAPKSRPSEETDAMTRPSTALRTSLNPVLASCQRPRA
jgi:hypothetical protein